VDFSRVASARALLQASADAAAIAGAGAWQTSQSYFNASNVTSAAYSGTASQLSNFVATSAPTPELTCTGSTTQCGGTASSSTYVTTPSTYGCPTSSEYCVVVQATGVLKNSLFAWLIPSETLNVKSIATTAFPPNTISGSNFSSTSVGQAYDLSGIYAYAVPMTASGGTPDYTNVPTANTDCTSSNSGPISYESDKVAPANGVTECNYTLIGTSKSSTSSGSITFAADDPIAFAFANMTGETTPYGLDGTYAYISNITYSTSKITYDSNGNPTNGTFAASGHNVTYPSTGYNCSGSWSNNQCTVPLYGECPQHNLYGSFSQGSGGSQVYNGATSDDSLNIYSSAYEVLGYPPTHLTNHALPSFASEIKETIHNTTYYVSVQCPQWPITHSQEVADSGPGYVPKDTNITAGTATTVTSGMVAPSTNAYSTYYPDTINTDSSGDIYPPTVSGCTAASYPNASYNNPPSSAAWWGWSGSNSSNCGNEPSSDTGYNNCALIIQPLGLGTNIPKDSNGNPRLPDYYNIIEDSSGNVLALDPVWDNATYVDVLTGVSVTDSDPSGSYPANSIPNATTTINNSTHVHGSTTAVYANTQYVGDKLVTVASDPNGPGDQTLPGVTSNRCYNPKANGSSHGYVKNSVGNFQLPTGTIDNNSGTTIDPISNPQDGTILCGSSVYQGQSFGIYWNDEGGGGGDPIGYWNAATLFTCPVPGSGTTGGGPATLSG